MFLKKKKKLLCEIVAVRERKREKNLLPSADLFPRRPQRPDRSQEPEAPTNVSGNDPNTSDSCCCISRGVGSEWNADIAGREATTLAPEKLLAAQYISLRSSSSQKST